MATPLRTVKVCLGVNNRTTSASVVRFALTDTRRLLWVVAAKGHQERFSPPRLSGRCGFESGPLRLMIDERDF